MPPYWRNFNYRRRRRTFWRRRSGKTIFRRQRRWRKPRRPYRKRFWVRRRHFKIHRKLKKLKLYQYQPDTIKKCKIIGSTCLFQGDPLRTMFNFTQYMYSFVPEEEPGGGGYCVMIESLGSLYEDFVHLKNVWTTSNAGLPLVRVLGATLTFMQDEYTDYCVEIDTCPPLKDFQYTHTDIAPNRMLSKKNVIRVPSRQTRRKRRPFKRVHITPPKQLQNKWYFQKDICDFPLVLIKATSVDFKHAYGDPEWQSNNITLTCINPVLIQRHDFRGFSSTEGWFPKANTYLYVNTVDEEPKATSRMIYLGNTKDNQPGTGKSLSEIKTSTVTDWGNPFHHNYLDNTVTIWVANSPPSRLTSFTNNTFTKLQENLLQKVRYNPDKDTGQNNELYIVPNTQNTGWDPPQNQHLVLSGFPLYDMIFGYIDWLEKLHEAQKILENYIVVMRSDFFDFKMYAYAPLDQEFLDGFSAYKGQESKIPVTAFDKHWWYPRTKNQLKSLNTLALCGPGCLRTNQYIQAQMKYCFYLKFGGCPKTLEKPYDPCSQPTWTIPNNITSGLQIENPGTNPQTYIQSFDWRRDYIKTKTIERIKEHTETDDFLQFSTESKHNLPVQRQKTKTSQETDSETEETEASLKAQIKQLRQQQQLLKQHILQQLQLPSLE
nr:MAG: ORF1 [Anelloviridae sp.]